MCYSVEALLSFSSPLGCDTQLSRPAVRLSRSFLFPLNSCATWLFQTFHRPVEIKYRGKRENNIQKEKDYSSYACFSTRGVIVIRLNVVNNIK